MANPIERATYDEVVHINEHFENTEKYFGKKAVSDSTHAMDDTLTPFTLTSGNNAYGTAIPIVGSADTPIDPDGIFYMVRKILCTNLSANTPYKIKFAWGASWAAGNITEVMFASTAANFRSNVTDINMQDLPSGTILWAACWNATNLATCDLFISMHEHIMSE